MKKSILLILFLIPVISLANFPVKQSQTWEVKEDKILVSNRSEVLWEVEHSCDKNIREGDRVSVHVNQSRVRRNTYLELVVNGQPQMCQVERVQFLR